MKLLDILPALEAGARAYRLDQSWCKQARISLWKASKGGLFHIKGHYSEHPDAEELYSFQLEDITADDWVLAKDYQMLTDELWHKFVHGAKIKRKSWPTKFAPCVSFKEGNSVLHQTARTDEPFVPTAEDLSAEDWVIDDAHTGV